MHIYNAGAPMERLALDVMGPLPLSSRGNKYLLVVTDYFTKWPEAFPLPNQEIGTVAEVLVNEVVCLFGVPLELHSDQGRNFESAVFSEMCNLLGIKKTHTTPLHQTAWWNASTELWKPSWLCLLNTINKTGMNTSLT